MGDEVVTVRGEPVAKWSTFIGRGCAVSVHTIDAELTIKFRLSGISRMTSGKLLYPTVRNTYVPKKDGQHTHRAANMPRLIHRNRPRSN